MKVNVYQMPKLVLTLLIMQISLSVRAQVEIGGIRYNLISSTKQAEVTNNENYSGSITIPSTIVYESVEYSVTSIGSRAFYNCTRLTAITISKSIKSIGSSAFYGCSNLVTLKVESGNVKYDSRNNCNGIIETSTNKLILGCKKTTIPNSVTSIGSGAFSGCSGLTSITIPNSVKSISSDAFENCSNLTKIKVESGNTKYDSRDNCNGIIETATNTLVLGCKGTVVPNSVTEIGNFALSECSALVSITIPNSVTSIGAYAFDGCTGLTSITIGNGVRYIGNDAFRNCCSLTNIKVESGNTIYDSRNNCNGIIETSTNTLVLGCKSTIIPDNVTAIGGKSFYGCSNLTSIIIPNGVTSIGAYAFYGCSNLTSISVPNSVINVGGDAFTQTAWYNNQSNCVVYVGRVLYKYRGTMTAARCRCSGSASSTGGQVQVLK